MFKCRVCSEIPFASLLGFGDVTDDEKPREEKATFKSDDGASLVRKTATLAQPPNADDLPNPEPEQLEGPRNAEEVGYLAKTWDTYVHERVKQLWTNVKTRKEVLKSIVRGCSKKDDPILGNDVACVKWIGPYDNGHPVIYMTRPGESNESSTYVTRMMVFLFADQESFDKVNKNEYTSFPMTCGNAWCINLTHIAVA